MSQEAPDQQVPALDELHAAFAGPLFMFAYRQTGDRQAAEEIVQDTLVTAWQRADRFDPRRGSLAGWLFTIARNRGRDLLRRRAVRPGVGGEPEVLADPQPAEVDAAIEAWELAEALARLSSEHREAILEVHYLGFTVPEAAARLELPEGTVKSRLYYGLRSLRLALEEMGVVG